MTPVDWVILLILALSTLFSLLRGFVKEALSLLVWFAAFALTYSYSDTLATLLPPDIESPAARSAIAVAVLFFGSFIVGMIISRLIAKFIKVAGLSALDRILGMAFGLLRGFLVVLVLMILLKSLVDVERYQWWQSSILITQIELIQQGFLNTAGK